MSGRSKHAKMQRLGTVMLLAGALATSGCNKDQREIGGAVAFVAVTAPLWGPVALVRSLGPDNPSPTVTSSSPGVIVETKRVELPGKLNTFSNGAYPAGAGRFTVLYNNFAAVLDASDTTVHAARGLPGDLSTVLGMRDGNLFAVSRDRSRLMVLGEGSTSIQTAPLPALGCQAYVPSPHLQFAACVTWTVVTAVNLDTHQAAARVEGRPNGSLDDVVAVSDDGHLIVGNVFGTVFRSPATQGSSMIKGPHGSILHAVAGPSSRPLGYAAYGPPPDFPNDSRSTRVAIVDLQSGATLADVPHEGYVHFAVANEAGRIAITGGDEVVIVAPSQGGTEVIRISMGGGFGNLPNWAEWAAWDDRGEWLLLLRGNGKGHLLRFRPIGNTITGVAPPQG